MTNVVASTNAADLIPFTGFYALSAGSGSFILIDTNLINADGAITYEASITLSLEGTSSGKYDFAACCTFVNNVLTVNNGAQVIASVTLSSVNSGGIVSQLSGTYDGVPVKGSTPFNPIPMDVFATTYYDAIQTTEGAIYVETLKIEPNGAVYYRPDGYGELLPVDAYFYNYAMFVIEFVVAGQKTTLEMGTASGSGRVAGNSNKGGLLVSICNVTPYPPRQSRVHRQLAHAD